MYICFLDVGISTLFPHYKYNMTSLQTHVAHHWCTRIKPGGPYADTSTLIALDYICSKQICDSCLTQSLHLKRICPSLLSCSQSWGHETLVACSSLGDTVALDWEIEGEGELCLW